MRRVAITGIGIISSLGNSFSEVSASLAAGRSGIEPVEEWAQLGLSSTVAGRLCDVDEHRQATGLTKRRSAAMSEAALLCAIAAKDAVHDAGIEPSEIHGSAAGCIVASGISSTETIYRNAKRLKEGRPRRIDPTTVLRAMSSSCSASVSTLLGLRGPSYSISSACATSAHCIGNASDLIRSGRLDMALAGGAEGIDANIAAAFGALRAALSTSYNDRPTAASRPFDRARDGFVLSGGSGVLLLEELERARARGARVRGEILGYGANSDGGDLVMPDPSGQSAAACMGLALRDGALQPEQVDAINAHATSTPVGDLAEGRASVLSSASGCHRSLQPSRSPAMPSAPPAPTKSSIASPGSPTVSCHRSSTCSNPTRSSTICPSSGPPGLPRSGSFSPTASDLVAPTRPWRSAPSTDQETRDRLGVLSRASSRTACKPGNSRLPAHVPATNVQLPGSIFMLNTTRSQILSAALLTLVLMLSVSDANAQTKTWKKWYGHFYGSYSAPQGDSADVAKDGWGLGGGATYRPDGWPVGILLDLAYNDFGIERRVLDAADAQGGSVDVWSLTPGLLWSSRGDSRFGVQLSAAAGVYRLEGKLTEAGFYQGIICPPWSWWCYPGIIPGDKILASESTTDFGWNVGLGLNWEVGLGNEVFFEVRYHRMETDIATEFIPFSFGYRW